MHAPEYNSACVENVMYTSEIHTYLSENLRICKVRTHKNVWNTAQTYAKDAHTSQNRRMRLNLTMHALENRCKRCQNQHTRHKTDVCAWKKYVCVYFITLTLKWTNVYVRLKTVWHQTPPASGHVFDWWSPSTCLMTNFPLFEICHLFFFTNLKTCVFLKTCVYLFSCYYVAGIIFGKNLTYVNIERP